MREAIKRALGEIEQERRVRVLYACESGSRAWGFASDDSDYDVRFIYVHERNWYLSIADHRDVIEQVLPGDLDMSGWELRKALRLFRKSNPPLLEWLTSPIVYHEDSDFTGRLRSLMAEHYSPSSCFRHYLHMAEGNARGYLAGETVCTKKYLYVLRPLLGCRWIEQNRGPVPMAFERLLETLSDRVVLDAIKDLVEKKRSGAELDSGPPIDVLAKFIETEVFRLGALPYHKVAAKPTEELDALFRETLS